MRQVGVASLQSSPYELDWSVQVMNAHSRSDLLSHLDVAGAMGPQKEAVVQDDIDLPLQEIAGDIPNQRPTGFHSSDVLIMAYCFNAVTAKERDKPVV